MTREDFKKKYHGKSVKIETIMREASVHQRQSRIQEMCKLMGLEAHQVSVPAPYLLISIVDKNQTPYPYSHVEASEPVSEEEFLADFDHCVKVEEQAGVTKVLDILHGMKVKDVNIKHVGVSRNMKQLAEGGFIQGYTSNEASLWWNPNGRRLLFVRNEGVFELTDKVGENA